MAALTSNDSILRPQRDVRLLLVKWIVALFVPIAVFTFIWSGEEIINNVFLGLMNTASSATVVVSEVAGKAVVMDHDGLVTVSDMSVSIQAFALDATGHV